MSGDLGHVYWIGGSGGAGKSTIARRLAVLYEFEVYATDDVNQDHAGRLTPPDAPNLASFIAMDMDERWLNRSPQAMLDTFHWFEGEGFELIVDDLRNVRSGQGVVAEGLRLLPRLVKPHLAQVHHAVWLLPTPAFRRAAIESRGGSSWAFLGMTSDPNRALENLLARDHMFTEQVHADAKRLGLPVIEVDITMTEDELLDQVEEVLINGAWS